MRKLIKILPFLFLFFLPFSLLGITKVHAEEDFSKIKFVLHKRMYIDPKADPEEISNTGLEMLDDEFMDQEITYGLNDVVFEVYDLTDYVNKQRKEEKTTQEIQKYISDTEPDKLAELFKKNLVDTVVTKTIDGESGIAIFEATSNEEVPAYLILEKAAPLINGQAIIKMAMPMLVVLPIENPLEAGINLSTVHLYPKNAQYNVPERKKKKLPIPKPEPVTKKRFLPQTGEIKSAMAILGSVIIAIVIWLRRRKRNTQQSI